MEYKLIEIAKVINGLLTTGYENIIQNVFIDSRNIIDAESSLFFAISGKNNNGHDYIPELIERGIKNFVVENRDLQLKHSDANFIKVNNSLQAFQEFAAWHRESFKTDVIGITGSNGKTIIKEWLYYILNNTKSIVRSPKSFNSQVGVPLSVLLLEKHHQLAIFEAGISQPGEMEALQKIIKPNIGIFTNIGDAHQENFKSQEQKIIEKIKLFSNCDELIYNADNAILVNLLTKTYPEKLRNFCSWSMQGNGDLNIKKIMLQGKTTEITGEFESITYKIIIPFEDKASIENAIHVWCFLLAKNIFNEAIKEKFKTLPVIGMRLELMEGINNCTIINDSYNSDLNSIKIALDFLKRQKQHENKCLIISDILQSGESEEILYGKLNNLIIHSNLNQLIAVGEKISIFLKVKEIKCQFFKTTEELLQSNILRTLANQSLLIKGAREFQFEKISKYLQKRTHRTVLEINLEALQNNLNYFRSLLKPETKVLVMVKAFSYGSGSFEIAQFLEHQRVDYLGVAFTDEGVNLRKAGVKLPILVLNPEEGSFKNIIEYQLEPEIHNFRSLEQFHKVLESTSRENYPVHIKIDTGMKRLGFDVDEIPNLINILKHYRYLKIKGIMSHLAAGDSPEHKQFTKHQITKFQQTGDLLQKNIKHKIIRHILNSGGIENYPKAQFEMVRLGIGLYGISSKEDSHLENISTLKSHISQIRMVNKDETIGYGRLGLLKRNSKIAIIPIGYADGLNRKLGYGNGYVIINSKKAPFVGSICMDMCMVDITDIKANEGDEVIIFGKDLPVALLAKKLDTIPYEILTSISQRVKRVYVH